MVIFIGFTCGLNADYLFLLFVQIILQAMFVILEGSEFKLD